MGRRLKLSDRIAGIVRSRQIVTMAQLLDALESDPRVPGALELTDGQGQVLAHNVSSAFLAAIREARDAGRVELLITPGTAVFRPGRVERARLERALLERRITDAFHPFRA